MSEGHRVVTEGFVLRLLITVVVISAMTSTIVAAIGIAIASHWLCK